MEKITLRMLDEHIKACPLLEKGEPRFEALQQRLSQVYGQEYGFDSEALSRLEEWTGLVCRGEIPL
jgi:hypothetical protein